MAASLTSVVTLAPDRAAAQIGNKRPPRPDVTLPEGPVRQVILSSCTQCHGIDEYGYYAMDREHWDALIERMKTARSGRVEGAVISDADKKILLDWLVSEFGPDATPFPREYVVRPLNDAERLDRDAAADLLATGCTSCHGLERVSLAALDEAGWRERILHEIARGASLQVQNAEPLVQWLANARGTEAPSRR
jgi:cytochrome c553